MSSINDSYSTLPDNIFKFKQSHITIKTGYVVLFFSGLLFLLMGLTLFFLQVKDHDYSVDYTDCKNIADPKVFCRNATKLINCSCHVQISVPLSIYSRVFLYYQLIDFNQNIRIYANSYDQKQLLGWFNRGLIPSTSCMAMEKVDDKYIVPCGLVANSMFNDTFVILDNNKQPINIKSTKLGISSRFKNPKSQPLDSAFTNYAQPPNWNKPIYELDPDNPSNNGLENYNFKSWMSIFPFNDALKLYGELDLNHDFLPKGNYTVEIDYNFIISDRVGRKIIRLHHLGILGSRNLFMAIIYMSSAAIALTFSFIFFTYVRIIRL